MLLTCSDAAVYGCRARPGGDPIELVVWLPVLGRKMDVPYCFDGAVNVTMGVRLLHPTQTGICEQNNKHKCHTDQKGFDDHVLTW